MDKAKAIEVLKPLANSYVDYANITMKEEDDDIAEALEMAIDVLRQPEPSTSCSEFPNNSDTVSRQAAIDLFPNDVLEWDTLNGYIAPHVARRLIEQLPPAQTEPAIPLSWIEKHIEWHKSLDSEFANLAAAHISVMVKKWRDEQDETD